MSDIPNYVTSEPVERNLNKEVGIHKRDKSGRLIHWGREISPHLGAEIQNVHPSVKLRIPENYSFSVKNQSSAALQSLLSPISSGLVGGIITAAGALRSVGGELEGQDLTESESSDLEKAATFNPWFQHLKAWKNTEPLETTLQFDFKLGQYRLWNAKKEVALPIIALLDLVIPSKITGIYMEGPFQSTGELYGAFLGSAISAGRDSIDPTASIGDNIRNVATSLGGITGTLKEVARRRTCYLSIGRTVIFSHCYCTSASVSFTNEVDQHGMPVSGSISLSFVGYAPPTKQFGTTPEERGSKDNYTYRFLDDNHWR